MAKVFIGMPVYNGEEYVGQAIDSLIKQSFRDWKLFISNNASTDKTLEICQRKAIIDERISIFNQPVNLGPFDNFKFLVNQADCDYFMWAAHDDLWHEDFISVLLKKMNENNEIGMAFCNPVIINSNNKTITRYPLFKKFNTGNCLDAVINFLRDPEVNGKANLVYSIFKTELIKKIYDIYPMNKNWGSDIVLAFCGVCRTKLYVSKKVLFFKRDKNFINDKKIPIQIDKIRHPDNYIFPVKFSKLYIDELILVSKNTKYENLTKTIMLLRSELLRKNNVIRFRRVMEIIKNIFKRLTKLRAS